MAHSVYAQLQRVQNIRQLYSVIRYHAKKECCTGYLIELINTDVRVAANSALSVFCDLMSDLSQLLDCTRCRS